MELLFVFLPGVAFIAGAFLGIKDSWAHGDDMYELGKRHGIEIASEQLYKLSLDLIDEEREYF